MGDCTIRRSGPVKPSDYDLEPEDSPHMQALAELIAEGLVEAKGCKFQNGKWRTVWGPTDRGFRHLGQPDGNLVRASTKG